MKQLRHINSNRSDAYFLKYAVPEWIPFIGYKNERFPPRVNVFLYVLHHDLTKDSKRYFFNDLAQGRYKIARLLKLFRKVSGEWPKNLDKLVSDYNHPGSQASKTGAKRLYENREDYRKIQEYAYRLCFRQFFRLAR